jgi:hypothetical protein
MVHKDEEAQKRFGISHEWIFAERGRLDHRRQQRPVEDFPCEHYCKFRTDAVQLYRPAHFLGARVTRWFAPFDQPIAFGFDLAHLLGDHL